MSRPIFALLLLALVCVMLANPGASASMPALKARYVVELSAPSLRLEASLADQEATLQQVATAQTQSLAAITAALGVSVQPDYVYRHALNGFALRLTADQAATVAALPGVAQVQQEWFDQPLTDASPAFIGVAQTDQRPALFYAPLTADQAMLPVQSRATGRTIARYNAAEHALSFQIFYQGLSSPPAATTLRQGLPGQTGDLVLDLAGFAVGTPADQGGYIATVTLDAPAEASLFAERLFVSLATTAFPQGELRGQLVPSRGEGIVVGVIDTGIDPKHPSFQDPGPYDSYAYHNPRSDGRYLGVCSPDDADGRYDPTFPCNDKLIGAYTFDQTSEVSDPQGHPSPNDNLGHGSHVAGIVAGNLVSGAVVDGSSLGLIAGVAPHANLIVYDVCGIPTNDRGCPSTAIIAAIDQAVADGVDVLSYSLGGETRSPWVFADAQALLRAVERGIFVAVAVGNRGNEGAGTINAPANAPWVTGVGAVSDGHRPPELTPDLLYSYSSLGPDRSVPDLVKPDLVAPGVDIAAANADFTPNVDDFALRSGTSMATPHVSGLAALLRQMHPDWSPAAIRSAMMLTAVEVRQEGGAPANPFAQGAGRIAGEQAALAGFVLDETSANYRKADPALGGTVSSLNLPALVDSHCISTCSFTRTLRSTLGVTVTWQIATSGDGLTLTTEPAGQLTLGPGVTATLMITATATRFTPNSYAYGRVSFTANNKLAPPASLPVAMPLNSSNLPTETMIQTRSHEGTQALALQASAISGLSLRTTGLTRLEPTFIALAEDPTPKDRNDLAAGGLYRQQVILPIGNARLRVQLDHTTARDLDLFVYSDADGAGAGSFGPEDQLLCQQTSPGPSEVCDITAPDLLNGRAQATTVTILVQNCQGSGVPSDTLRLSWGLLSANPPVPQANLRVIGPESVPAGERFEVQLAWSLTDAQPDDVYIGLLTLGSSPATPSDLGTTLLTLKFTPYRLNLPLIQRSLAPP